VSRTKEEGSRSVFCNLIRGKIRKQGKKKKDIYSLQEAVSNHYSYFK